MLYPSPFFFSVSFFASLTCDLLNPCKQGVSPPFWIRNLVAFGSQNSWLLLAMEVCLGLEPLEVSLVCVRRLLFHQLWRRKAEGMLFFLGCYGSLKSYFKRRLPCVMCCDPWNWQPAANISDSANIFSWNPFVYGVTLRPSEKEAQIAGFFERNCWSVRSHWYSFHHGRLVGSSLKCGFNVMGQSHVIPFANSAFMASCSSWVELQVADTHSGQNEEPNMSQTTDSIEGLTRWELLEKGHWMWFGLAFHWMVLRKWFKMIQDAFLYIGFTSSRNKNIILRTFFISPGWIFSPGKCFKTLSRRWLDMKLQLLIKVLSCWKDWGSWGTPIATWFNCLRSHFFFILPLLTLKKC